MRLVKNKLLRIRERLTFNQFQSTGTKSISILIVPN